MSRNPYANNPVVNSSFSEHNICNFNLKIFYQNVRGLKTKLINIRCAFPMLSIYDVIVLTETWLSPDIKDAELGFVGFQVYRLDRNPNNSPFSRGVLIAIISSLKSHPVPLNVSNVEQVYALVSINTNNFLVGCVYLPPVAPLTIVESHLSSVKNVLSNLNKLFPFFLLYPLW